MNINLQSSKLIGLVILLIALDIHRAAAQEGLSIASVRVGSQLTATTATFRARRDRVMQAAPDALVLVRSRSTLMAANADGFRQTAAFYYLTGLENAIGALLVVDSKSHASWLFVPSAGQLPRGGSFLHPPYGYVDPEQ